MPGIDEKRKFIPVHIAVMTVSDTRDEETDKSGRVLKACIEAAGHVVKAKVLVKDDQAEITAQLKIFLADPAIDVVIATGGTGLTGRDVTPEAFKALY